MSGSFLPRSHIAHLSLLIAYRSDTSARHEPQQPPPHNQRPTPVRWPVLDMAPDIRANMPDSGDPRGVSWGAGNSNIHRVERGTSQIHQPDTPMPLASLRPNANKRADPDSSPAGRPATPAAHNVSDGQPPQRSRPQSAAPPWPAVGPVPGNLTSGA